MVGNAVHRPGQKTIGPWGPHTSTLDWCEDNYTHFDYIAETWNTVSNVIYVFLGIYGALSTRGLASRNRYALAYYSISLIGIGSAVFHGTLLWHAQVLLDELPMIWSATLCLYLAAVGEKAQGSLKLKIWSLIVPFVISVVYLRYPNPVFHQLCYGVIQLCSATLIARLFKSVDVSTPSRASRIQECKQIMTSGVITFILGFVIWNIDNIFCDTLTSFRKGRGELIGLLTQGHAWWHLLTGIGATHVVTSLIYLTLSVKEPDGYEFNGMIPVVRKQVSKGKKA